MNLLNFVANFPGEESCKRRWKEVRDRQGVICQKCGGESHYWKSDKESYECKNCGYRQSLKANTIMHGSWLPFRYWFAAIHLIISTKKSFSAKELQRQVGYKYYEPIWAMMHKIRSAMGKRDSLYNLSGIIESDEGFFSTEVSDNEKNNLKDATINEQVKTLACNVTMSNLNFYKNILMNFLRNSIGGTSASRNLSGCLWHPYPTKINLGILYDKH